MNDMKIHPPAPRLKPGLTRPELISMISVIGMVTLGLIYGAMLWKRGADRSQTILHIRNCQQAMRGHAGMRNLEIGKPFTRRDLEFFMTFPEDIWVPGGKIEFTPETVITPVGELWLQVKAPHTEGYIGRYGFDNAADFDDW